MINYYTDPNLYDLDYDARISDKVFYLKEAKKVRQVLELGSGTGRINLFLYKNNIKITGIEKNKKFIKLAEQKERNLNIIEADFCHFNLNQKFDLIIMPFNAFQEIHNNELALKCLASIKNHMHEKSKFIFDINNIDFSELDRDKTSFNLYDTFKAYYENNVLKRALDNNNNNNLLEEIIVEDNIDYDFESQIANYTLYYNFKDKNNNYINKITHKMYFPQEIKTLLNISGFDIVRKYGSFAYSKFSKNSPSQIFICAIK